MRRRNDWDPFEQMNRILKQLSDGSGQFTFQASGGFSNENITEEDETIIVTVDVPGFSKDEIDISLPSPRTLSISANSEDSNSPHKRTRSATRRMRLPSPVTPEQSKAKYKNGVLTIHLQKQEHSEKDNTIEIE